MNALRKPLLGLSLVASSVLSTASFASTSPPDSITGINVMTQNGGKVIFYTAATRPGTPACATTGSHRWAFDGTLPGGQATLTALLAAYAAGKYVTVHGTGLCDVWGDTETVDFVEITSER